MPTIDRSFVDYWSQRYRQNMPAVETQLLSDGVGAQVRAQGYCSLEQLFAIGGWKAARSRAWLQRNTDDDVRDVTGLAFNAPERLQHRILCLLCGVQVPMASAVLTVWAPERHTVLDVRSVAALKALGELRGVQSFEGYPRYVDYLKVCRSISERLRVGLRDLDRALWRWDKEGEPAAWYG